MSAQPGVQQIQLTPVQPVSVVVQGVPQEGAVVADGYNVQGTKGKTAKKYWLLILLCVVGIGLIADGSYKAFTSCPFELKGQPGTGLQSGPISVKQGCSTGGSCFPISTPLPGGETINIPTCAMKLNSLMRVTAQEQFDACTGGSPEDSVCQFYSEGAQVDSAPLAACTVDLRDGPAAGDCGCGLATSTQLNFNIKIDLGMKLGQAKFCVQCGCTPAEDPSVNGITSNCGTDGACLDASATKAGQDSSGGGVNQLAVSFDKLGGKGICYSLDDLAKQGSDDNSSIPSWVEPVVRLVVILPAIILALLMLYFAAKLWKKTTVADMYKKQNCCGCCIFNAAFSIAVVLAGLIGAVFVFLLPKLMNDAIAENSGGTSTHLLEPTPTPAGTISVTTPECKSDTGAMAELAGGIVALLAWLLSCKCSSCLRF